MSANALRKLKKQDLSNMFESNLAFEVILLLIFTPIIAWVFDKGMGHTGTMGVGLSIIAMACNGIYNYVFDKALIQLNRPLYPRSFRLRCFHSVLFEFCLLFFALPWVMWCMNLTFFKAFVLDISFSVFVPIYALGFNWIYDLLLPVSHPSCTNTSSI